MIWFELHEEYVLMLRYSLGWSSFVCLEIEAVEIISFEGFFNFDEMFIKKVIFFTFDKMNIYINWFYPQTIKLRPYLITS